MDAVKGKDGPDCSEYGRTSFWNHAREPWTCTEESKSVLIMITLIEYFICLFSICRDNLSQMLTLPPRVETEKVPGLGQGILVVPFT